MKKWAAIGIAALALIGCGNSEPQAATTASAVPSASPTPSWSVAERELIAAWGLDPNSAAAAQFIREAWNICATTKDLDTATLAEALAMSLPEKRRNAVEIIAKLCPRDDLQQAAAIAGAGATPSPQSPPARTPVDEWVEKVNVNRKPSEGLYGPEDAASSCERLKDNPEAAWDAVGDDRLLWAGRLLCTEHKEQVERSVGGFRDGEHVVGAGEGQVAPGTYITRPETKDCYWERVSDSGETIGNDFVSFAPKGVRLTVRSSDAGVTARGCGAWVKA